ncbi:MAG: 3-hexulose-6-phosphate synthase [Subtercola sp.]|nr:3-hexulose-6-phosphate synthase [Subtercola sp.]
MPLSPQLQFQLALDLSSLEEASRLVRLLARRLTRIEVGTPLVISAGLASVAHIRQLAQAPVEIVADVKICDAGERIARTAFAAGADVVTAVAAAIDQITWRGVLDAVGERVFQLDAPAPVLLDTIGPRLEPDALDRYARMAADAGVAVDLCIHRPKVGSPSFAELREQLGGAATGFNTLAIAGRLTPADVHEAHEAGFGTLIVGGAIADAADPESAWAAFTDLAGSTEESGAPHGQSARR